MKRYIGIICLLALSLCMRAQSRLTPDKYQFISLHGDVGYSSLFHTISGQKPAVGANANIGVDFRMYRDHLLFSVGVEGMYEMNANQMDALDVTIPMIDTEGEPFTMHVQLDKSRDLTHVANVNIPLLLGGEWNRFYFMVGPKLSINLYGVTSSNALITTFGEYDAYYDDFYDMANHQFSSNQQMSSGTLPMKWNLNVLAHVEIGARLGHMFKHKQFRTNPDKIRMYLAAYVDYGVLNLRAGKGGNPVFQYRETEQGVQFYIQPLMLSNLSAGAEFHNFNAGVKYTIAFELPKHGKSYIYDWKTTDRDYRKRGGNQSLK